MPMPYTFFNVQKLMRREVIVNRREGEVRVLCYHCLNDEQAHERPGTVARRKPSMSRYCKYRIEISVIDNRTGNVAGKTSLSHT